MAKSIRSVRRAKDITQQDMADSLQIHVQTYRKIEENPESATIAQARQIADRLGVAYDDLLFTSNSTFSR